MARREVFSHRQSPKIRAFTVALGVFLAFTPLYGLQTIVGLALAFLLRLNKILIVVLVNLVTPYPAIPFIIYASYTIGGWFIPGAGFAGQPGSDNLVQYLTGGFLLAVFMGLISGMVAYPLFVYSRRRSQRSVVG